MHPHLSLSRRTYLIAGIVSLVLIAIGGILYYFLSRPEVITFNSYVCGDGSFYFVLQDKDAIEIVGQRYELESREAGDRYVGDGPIVYTITGSRLDVSYKDSGEQIASCELGTIDTAPIIQTNN